MRYIALEEAFSIPGFPLPGPSGHRPKSQYKVGIKPEVLRDFGRRLGDFDQYRIPEMDKHGIDIQVLSLTVPGIQAEVDPRIAVVKAVEANNYLAAAIAQNPSRFRGFAALPLQDPCAAADELRRCVEELGFCGALVNDHTQGHYLDEPQYDVFWDALESVGLPLYIHPGALPVEGWSVMSGYPEMVGAWSWAAETGAHALRLIYGGVFDRHPSATIILGHMGEFLPFQLSRLDARYLTLQHEHPIEHLPSEYVGANVFLTASGVFSPAVLKGAVMAVGADAVMFSTDYPYESTADTVACFEQTDLSEPERAKIASQNAERILKL